MMRRRVKNQQMKRDVKEKRRRRGGVSAESYYSAGRLYAYIQPVARNQQSKDSVAIFQQKRKISSSRLESAEAKQLTIYEELREMDVNC
ncbi:hypothetical protein F511_38313 [Dorcoceras hygrometricum]|uniref:Uncharacterized protein n=1 Tax=Dorcoceras hygrometricum TaxID=472368 RepID=A0A2Z7AUS0_9LAMI|nr:hypothetical protein F511_38313 [Dorcoceras hygrometricum]